MKETYQQTYIALPINKSPLLDFLKRLNPQKKFPHFTLYFLNNLSDYNLPDVKSVILSNPDLFKDISLKPNGLDTIGIHDKTFVLKIENTSKLSEIRNLFEDKIPDYLSANLPFLPHISIKKKFEKGYLSKITDLSNGVPSYSPSSIGVFYRTEENATALLFSHRIVNT